MLELIISYFPLFKDMASIVLSVVATIIAVKTYRRARLTLLQPLRSEVIKKQTSIFIDLLSFLRKKNLHSKSTMMYKELIKLNCYEQIERLGFNLKDSDEKRQFLREEIIGYVSITETKELRDDKVVQTFDSPFSQMNEDVSALRYDELKKGVYKIDVLAYGEYYQDFRSELNSFYDSILLPKQMRDILGKLIEIDNYNTLEAIPETINCFLSEILINHEKDEIAQYSISGLFDEFNRKRKSFDREVNDLREIVRDYLKIDMEW